MHIVHLIPGERLDEKQTEKISSDILLAVNPEKLSNTERFDQFIQKTKKETMQLFQNSPHIEFYIMYMMDLPATPYIVFITQKDDLLTFIDDYFDQEYDEGFDVIIANKSYGDLILGNHDGMLMQA